MVVDWRAPGGRAVLPGHRSRADGPGPPPPLRRPGPPAARHRGRAVRRRPPRRRPTSDGRHRSTAGRAPRLQHADRRARARPHRPARRHRRHHPGRAGRDHPLAAAGRARRAGRAGHGQDRRRPAPRRLPALHLPLPARGPGRAGRRAEPACSCATSSRCCRRSARPASSWPCSPTSSPTSRFGGADDRAVDAPGSRATRAWRGVIDQGRARPGAAAARATSSSRSARPTCASPSADERSASSATPAAASAATTPAAGSSRARCAPRWPPVRPRARVDAGRGARARCAADPRCARRSSGCGRCSPRPAAARPVRLARRCCGWPARGLLERRRVDVAATGPASDDGRRGRAGPSDDVALLDEARALLGPRRPAQGRQGRRRRRDPHLRPHRRSTRRRTSRRCSCGWSPAGRSTAR